MPLTLHAVSVPVFVRALKALDALLTKGEESAVARGFDPAVLLTSRLAPDMFPLTRQVQIASDGAKGGAARLAGQAPPSYPDTETTFAELHERIAKTITWLEGLDPAAFDGDPDAAMVVTMGGQDYPFTRQSFLFGFVLPNMYFHVSAAYNILRHNGVAVGKRDYLGGL
jgi:hypothetical protein